nr:hypothetical protein [Pseudomonadota bacterium]
MKATLLVAAAAAVVAAAGSPPLPSAQVTPIAIRSAPAARLPGFAAELSQQPVIQGPGAWAIIPEEKAWAALARAGVDTRQAARWAYARSLLGRGFSADAFGVLQVMGQDDPDLALIDSYRLARGAALAGMGRSADAIEALVGPGLAANPEACAWRLLVLAKEKLSREALQQLACAEPALKVRPLADRAPFLLAAAGAALHAGKPDLTIRWLRPLARSNPAADLLRGRAHQALGQNQDARLALSRAIKNGNFEQRLDAEVSEIEAAVQARSMPPAQALKRLQHIRYVWRGGEVEERALRLSYRLSSAIGDLRTALSAGSALFSYFNLGADGGQVMAGLQKQLGAAIDPASRMPLDQALGLYWDFRHLTPMGAEGDLLVSRLGERLQAAGLYARAADLFEHQLFARAKDLAQGPLSAKVARLHILA